MSNSHLHSLMKAISWRFFGSIATGGLVYVFTGNLSAAVSVGGVEAFGKIILFYLHERLWNQISMRPYRLKKTVGKGM